MLTVLCLLIFSIQPGISGHLEKDGESLKSRLVEMEHIMSKQMKIISDHDSRLTKQEKVTEKQDRLIGDQEREIALLKMAKVEQEKVIVMQKEEMVKQAKAMKKQEVLIAKIMTDLNMDRTTKTTSTNKHDTTKILENPSLEERVEYLEEVSKIKVLRTCAEMEQHGVTSSGFYHLDPDGDMLGNPPIRAFCDFENGVTEILHDADGELIDISHCEDNLCYKRDIVYTAQMEQIKSLIDLSASCDQTIEFDCYLAPLNYGDVQIGVWTDRHGEDQIYFDGAHYGEHLCSCHNYNNCTGEEVLHNKCNCDNNSVPDWMQDMGRITNKTALPVMAFKYGPLSYDAQQAKFRVGRLRCRGMKEVSSVPRTCKDLKLFGETRPGLYHLQDEEHGNYPKISFCQLDQPGYEDDMELESHWVKMSSGPDQVFFSVKHNGRNDITNGAVITFDVIVANNGQAMNPSSGIFTAPVEGVYAFQLSGLTEHKEADPTVVDVRLNGQLELRMYDDNTEYASISRAWEFDLKKGDEVKLIKTGGGLHGEIYGLYFTGMLM